MGSTGLQDGVWPRLGQAAGDKIRLNNYVTDNYKMRTWPVWRNRVINTKHFRLRDARLYNTESSQPGEGEISVLQCMVQS